MNVAKVMTRDASACSPRDTLNRAAQLMWERDCGFLPVIDEERHVVGVVTDRDICMGSYTQGKALWDLPVSSVMSKLVHTCDPGDDATDVERTMRDKKIRRVPVVDGAGELVGVVTLGDLARCSQSGPLSKATSGLAIAKTLASICEPRAPQESTVAAE
jgi:CBS-domain-containing membrane protein